MGFGNGSLLCALAVEMFASSTRDYQYYLDNKYPELAQSGFALIVIGSVVSGTRSHHGCIEQNIFT